MHNMINYMQFIACAVFLWISYTHLVAFNSDFSFVSPSIVVEREPFSLFINTRLFKEMKLKLHSKDIILVNSFVSRFVKLNTRN